MFGKKNKQEELPAAANDADDDLSAPEEQGALGESFATSVRERMLGAEDAHKTLVLEALARGVPEDQLPALVADALTAHATPRVFRGTSNRSGGVSLFLVDGTIPASAVSVRTRRDENGNLTDSIVGFKTVITDPEESGYTGYPTPNLPIIDGPTAARYTNDPAIIERIDGFMAVDEALQTAELAQ